MDFGQRLGNLLGGKGFVSDEEKRRQEELARQRAQQKQVIAPQNTLRQQVVKPVQSPTVNVQSAQSAIRPEKLRIQQRADKGFDFYDNNRKINLDEYSRLKGLNQQAKRGLVQSFAESGDKTSQGILDQSRQLESSLRERNKLSTPVNSALESAKILTENIVAGGKLFGSAGATAIAGLTGDKNLVKAGREQSKEDFMNLPLVRDVLNPIGTTAGATLAAQKLLDDGVDPQIVKQALDEKTKQFNVSTEQSATENAFNIAAPYGGLALSSTALAGLNGLNQAARSGEKVAEVAKKEVVEDIVRESGARTSQEVRQARQAAEELVESGTDLVNQNPRKPALDANDWAPDPNLPRINDTFQPVSFNQLQRMSQGDTGAAISLLRNTGRNFEPQVEQQIAQELSFAQSPQQATAVLNKYGIPIEEAPVEEVAQAAARATNQAPIEELQAPAAPVNDTPVASSADIAQGGFSPANLSSAEQASLQEISNKIGRGEPLTQSEELLYQKANGVPNAEGAVKRALTPEEERPFSRQAVNPAMIDNNQGGVKPLTRFGEAGDDLAQFQQALSTEGSALSRNVELGAPKYFRQTENQLRKIEAKSPEIAQNIDSLRVMRQDAQAAANLEKIERQTQLDDITRGVNKKQAEDLRFILENYSNKQKVGQFEGTEIFQKATQVREMLTGVIEQVNPVLRANGIKEIGKVEDYFPRMQQLNSAKNLSEDLKGILGASMEQAGQYGDRTLSRSFMKQRQLEEAVGKQVNPVEALNIYMRQATDLANLAPVAQRGRAMVQAAEAVESLHPTAKKQVVDLLKNFNNQVTGGSVPTTSGAKIAKTLTNVVSRSQIAGSINTLLTSVASPVYASVNNVLERGIIKGTGNTVALLVRAARNMGRLGEKNIEKLADIDGMKSSYLIEAAGTNASKRNPGKRISNAGYAFSNMGELPVKAAFVEQRYYSLRNADPNLPKEQALRQAERDANFVLGNRAAGERSTFTSSNKAVPILFSQYQVEQIANVASFVDGVMLNPKASGWKKFAATVTALGAAYGANQAVSVATQGQIKPLPDLVGATFDALEQVERTNQERINNGEKPLTDAERASMVMGNTLSNFVSNLPLGRTALSGASAGADFAGVSEQAEQYGLNPRDTNPAQTLPTVGALGNILNSAKKVVQGDENVVEGALDIGSKFVPFGGQANRTREGVIDFTQGESRYPADQGQEKGDLKYSIENDLSTPEGVRNLVTMIASGRMANPGAQEWIKSGFQNQSDREVKNATYTAEQVGALTDEQYSSYEKAISTRLKNSLEGKDKEVYDLVNGKADNRERALASGKITQDQVDDMEARINRDYYEKGLVNKINTGYDAEFLKNSSPDVQKFIIERAIEGKTKFDKDTSVNPTADAVVNNAFMDGNGWPTIQNSYLQSTNQEAKNYIEFRKSMQEAGDDATAQLEAQEKFWATGVKGGFGEEAKNLYSQSVSTILALANGRTVNGNNYSINKTQLDEAIEIDNRLLKAGLISSPKFSNKNREALGYGAAPVSELDGIGYTPAASGGGGSRGGTKTYAGDLLTSFGGRENPGFKLNIAGDQTKTPSLKLSEFANRGSKSGKSSIKIKL